MLTTGPASRGGVPANPPPAGGPAQKPPGNGVAGGPGVPTAVVSAAHVQTSPQAKVLLHVSGQMTVSQARSAARAGGRWAGPWEGGLSSLRPCTPEAVRM